MSKQLSCEQVRQLLYPVPESCALTAETAVAIQHWRQCASCQGFFEDQMAWSSSLREKADVEPAPQSLRERIAALIAQELQVDTSWNWSALARLGWITAGLAAILVSGIWLTHYLSSERFFHELCEDHVKYLQGDSQFASEDPVSVESWLQGQVDFRVQVPHLKNARLLGGRLCFLKGKKAALIFYRSHDRPVSLFQFSATGISLRSLERWVVDAAPVWRRSWRGYSVLAFQDRGVISTLVSDVRESELLELASAARSRSH
jgi:hypothetical protein